MEWKRGQRVNFETLLSTSRSAGGTGPWSAKEVFKPQQGGLRIDSSLIQVESEFTKKGVNDSKDIIVTNIGGGRNIAGRGNYDSRSSYSRGPNQRGRDSDGRGGVKEESRNSRYDDRNRDRNWSRNGKSSGGRDDRSGSLRNDNESQRGRDRDERDRRRERSPRRNDSQTRARDREPEKKERENNRPHRSYSSSPRTSSSSNSRKRKRNENGGRSESRSPSRSHSRDRISSYYSRSDQKSSNYSRDRSDHKSDRKPSSRSDVKPRVKQEAYGK